MYSLHAACAASVASDAVRPDVPHFTCPDGYAWRRRGCVAPDVPIILVPAKLTSDAIDGEPLDRALACAEIARDYGEQALRLLYPPRCRRCGRDHWETDGRRLMRSGQAVQPDAVALLRAAGLPMRAFRVPDVPGDRRREGSGERSYAGLPIRSTPEATLAAQVAYAIRQRSWQRAAADPMVGLLRDKRGDQDGQRE